VDKDEALKLALEALEFYYDLYKEKGDANAITAIKEALANEALEKMAENARELGLDYEPEPVPVAVVRWNDIGHISWRTHVMLSDDTPLYTTPPQRTWVGLTDEEILSISADCAATHQHMDIQFARAIEAALKAKNT
jgi:hypothetical protein